MHDKIVFRNRKIKRFGSSFCILIPMAFIKTKMINPELNYKLTLEEEE